MKTPKYFSQVMLIMIVSLFIVTTASGHSVWLENRHDEIVVVYGHGPKDDSYTPDKIIGVTAYSADGEELEASIKVVNGGYVPLGIAEGTAIVEIEFDNGFWSQDADGKWHNLPKSQVKDAKQCGHYIKYGLAVLDHFTALPASFDLPLVIIPQSDPLTLHSGDEFRIRVMYKGQPLSYAEVIGDYVNQDSRVSAVTDADGFATMTIRNQGLNVIVVSKDEELKDNPDADNLGLMGSLSFTLTGAH